MTGRKLEGFLSLYKSGRRHHIGSYRTIANLNALPKLLELILTSGIIHAIKSIIACSQCALLKGKSTTTHPLEFVCHVLKPYLMVQILTLFPPI